MFWNRHLIRATANQISTIQNLRPSKIVSPFKLLLHSQLNSIWLLIKYQTLKWSLDLTLQNYKQNRTGSLRGTPQNVNRSLQREIVRMLNNKKPFVSIPVGIKIIGRTISFMSLSVYQLVIPKWKIKFFNTPLRVAIINWRWIYIFYQFGYTNKRVLLNSHDWILGKTRYSVLGIHQEKFQVPHRTKHFKLQCSIMKTFFANK